MAITHFEILSLPDTALVISKNGVNPLLINTLYPIAEQAQLTFNKTAIFNNISFSTQLTWRVYNDVEDIYSEEAIFYLTFRMPIVVIESLPKTVEILNDVSLNLFDELPISGSVEYIQIDSLEGYQGLKLNGQYLYAGQTLTQLELTNAIFTAGSSGGGAPYFSLKYYVGSEGKLYPLQTPTLYDYNIDIVTLAEIIEKQPRAINFETEDDDGEPLEFEIITEECIVELTNSVANGIANIQVVINSPFLSVNVLNYIEINNVVKTANETYNILVPIGPDGIVNISAKNYMIRDTNELIGEITFTLIDINGDPLLVSPTLNQVVISSFYDIILTADFNLQPVTVSV